MRRNDARARGTPGYRGFFLHRFSGLGLALFLPFHFLALAQSLRGEAALQTFLHWTDHPLFKIAEWGLVCLLAAHLLGGIRLLLIEFGSWRGLRLGMVTMALVLTGLIGAGLAFVMLS
jgi:fumarate reductase subunit D